jgi:hypothetical protein
MTAANPATTEVHRGRCCLIALPSNVGLRCAVSSGSDSEAVVAPRPPLLRIDVDGELLRGHQLPSIVSRLRALWSRVSSSLPAPTSAAGQSSRVRPSPGTAFRSAASKSTPLTLRRVGLPWSTPDLSEHGVHVRFTNDESAELATAADQAGRDRDRARPDQAPIAQL